MHLKKKNTDGVDNETSNRRLGWGRPFRFIRILIFLFFLDSERSEEPVGSTVTWFLFFFSPVLCGRIHDERP